MNKDWCKVNIYGDDTNICSKVHNVENIKEKVHNDDRRLVDKK